MQKLQQYQQDHHEQQKHQFRSLGQKVNSFLLTKILPILRYFINNRLLTTLLILNFILFQIISMKVWDYNHTQYLLSRSQLQHIIDSRFKISDQINLTNFSEFERNTKIYQPAKIQEADNKLLRQNCSSIKVMDSYYFALKMLENEIQSNNQSDCLQKQYLMRKYNISSISETSTESRIFIIATISSEKTKETDHFFTSLNRQKYSNYHLHLIADRLPDDEYNQLIQSLKKYPYVNNRIVISNNQKQIGMLETIDQVIRKYCKQGDIIIHSNAMSAFIGTRVLDLLNLMYRRDNKLWFAYTNHLQYNTQYGPSLIVNTRPGNSKKKPEGSIVRFNTQQQVVEPLFSYRYELYLKIPFYYFIDSNLNSYYQYISQNFLIFALTELAGDFHIKYVDQYLYLYYQQSTAKNSKIVCHQQNINYEQANAKSMAHFYPLADLSSQVQIERNATVSPLILSQMFQAEQILFQCLKINQSGFYGLS